MTYKVHPNHVRFFNDDGSHAGDAYLNPSQDNYALQLVESIEPFLLSYTLSIVAPIPMNSVEVRMGIRQMITDFYSNSQMHDHIIQFDISRGSEFADNDDRNIATMKTNAFIRYYELAPNKDEFEFILVSLMEDHEFGWYYGIILRKNNSRFNEITEGAMSLTSDHFIDC